MKKFTNRLKIDAKESESFEGEHVYQAEWLCLEDISKIYKTEKELFAALYIFE